MPKISRVVAGGLFALFLGLLIQALSVYGVINVAAGHVFMALAFLAGALLIATELIPGRPTGHKVTWIAVLGVIMLVVDLSAAHYRHQERGPEPLPNAPSSSMQVAPAPATPSMPSILNRDNRNPNKPIDATTLTLEDLFFRDLASTESVFSGKTFNSAEFGQIHIRTCTSIDLERNVVTVGYYIPFWNDTPPLVKGGLTG